ncbi:MAG TPA: hypothetical protein PL048_21530 [Leptospiraceae bacterium]|nr:hypothetical protein [Leptospiraceae bacterium]HMY67615.1 hypothetical protein [Leptospiraceae bacterium]HMZ61369.1 hypothetical protein [Leptospiraceae bacterium]HNF22997.1 hypothetical protein [Leptospiraceae bacterium]HNI96526.1 hypothetical protein [Leptospiraceae bacterium]
MRYLIAVLIMIFSFAECSEENNTAYCRRKKAEKELCMAFFSVTVQKEMQTTCRDALQFFYV